ncbi:hypothetical protein HX794_23760 [Pseudomonas costantinii]|uniref:hypothetical protein n=1 Tax=Pseudomonas costantinii TaxID=168469 RepID=UPI0015A3690D|nr:hypothetical protein [Pseudomonas costantinii]NVZ22665.1 hypothetical protein [Pseudomonas costantinii]
MSALRRPSSARLQKQVDNWNAKHPIGTLISFEEIVGHGETHRGASSDEATVFGGHTAVIFLQGKSGFVDLGHCTAIS